MAPTLKGGNNTGSSGIANFGIVDTNERALKQLKRFNIITTYYPWDEKDYANYVPGQKERDGYYPERKIKRILALPNETISVTNGDIYITPAPVIQEEIVLDKEYRFGAIPTDYEDNTNYYLSAPDWYHMYFATKYDVGTSIAFEDAGSGFYYFSFRRSEGKTYLNVSVTNHDKIKTTADMTASTKWKFNPTTHTFSTNITGHTDSSLDGEYTFALNEDRTLIVLKKVSEMNGLLPLYVLDREDGVIYSRELFDKETMKEFTNYTNKIIPFKREFDSKGYNCKDIGEIVIREGRYWVQGDHWSNSTDCHDYYPLYKENIEGILLAIEGTCKIGIKTYTKDGRIINEKVCTNHHYEIPKVF